jgi:hypothetical protein
MPLSRYTKKIESFLSNLIIGSSGGLDVSVAPPCHFMGPSHLKGTRDGYTQIVFLQRWHGPSVSNQNSWANE